MEYFILSLYPLGFILIILGTCTKKGREFLSIDGDPPQGKKRNSDPFTFRDPNQPF